MLHDVLFDPEVLSISKIVKNGYFVTLNSEGCKVMNEVWHKRLGHPSHRNFAKVRDLVKGLEAVSVKKFECVDCQLGKKHRLSFQSQ